MRTWQGPITIMSAIAAVMTTLWLLLASANPIEESVAPVPRSPLAQELADLLLIMQEEASMSYEPSPP